MKMTVESLALNTVKLLAEQVKHFINSPISVACQVFMLHEQVKPAKKLSGTEFYITITVTILQSINPYV